MVDIMSEQLVNDQKNEIIALLKSTGRVGVDGVLDFLEATGFYTLKSSYDRHHNWYGGLAQHSLGVYRQMTVMNARLSDPYPEDTVILVAILHDLCKAYNRRHSSSSISLAPEVYGHLNHRYVSLNHGSLSAALARYQCHLALSDEEYNAIKGHMHSSCTSPLQQLVYKADRADCKDTEKQGKTVK